MRVHLLLAATAAGAWFAPDWPWWAAPSAGAFAWATRRHHARACMSAALGFFVLASALAVHAEAALDFPDAGPFDQWVVLVDDPRPSGPVGVVATVRAGGRRLSVSAHGPVAGRLDDALAGERVRVVGRIRPVGQDDRWAIARHIVGRVTAVEVPARAEAAPVSRAANLIRRSLADGARSLDRSERPLFLGMVIGDDRGQSPVVADNFRAAGLGHLLVVSGQNVAFVLAVAMPLMGRLRPGGRALGLIGVIAMFAVVTRFEPSVLRASAMAGVGIGAAGLGRPIDGRKGLSLACTGLLLVDPFLVRLVGFQLSAAATAGIVWMGPALAERLPGPGWVRVPLSTTMAAQLAVSPLLVSLFGPMPVASLPANLLAGPASGAVMMWGCTTGLIAGIFGGSVAALAHLPTRGLLWWVDAVAAGAAAAPAASLGVGSLSVLGVVAVASIRIRGRGAGFVFGAVALVVLGRAVVIAPTPPEGLADLGSGVRLLTRGPDSVVILDDPRSAEIVLETLRTRGAPRPDLIVASDGDRADADVVLALRERYGDVAVAVPPLHRVRDGRTVSEGQQIDLAGLRLRVEAVDPRVEIAVLGPERSR